MKRFIREIQLTKFPISRKAVQHLVLYQEFFVHSTSYLESLHSSPYGGFGGGPFPLGWAHGNPSVKGKIGPRCKVLFWSFPFLLLEGSHRPVFSPLKWNNIVIVVQTLLKTRLCSRMQNDMLNTLLHILISRHLGARNLKISLIWLFHLGWQLNLVASALQRFWTQQQHHHHHQVQDLQMKMFLW